MKSRITWWLFLLSLTVGLLTISSTARADSLVYDFEQEGTRTVLAQLELSTFPVTHEEVGGLTFTPSGQEFFGYEFAAYPGTFATTCVPFIDDGMGGLTGEEYCFLNSPYIQSHDPPQSSLSPIQTRSFSMTALDVDTLELWSFDDNAPNSDIFLTATGASCRSQVPPRCSYIWPRTGFVGEASRVGQTDETLKIRYRIFYLMIALVNGVAVFIFAKLRPHLLTNGDEIK